MTLSPERRERDRINGSYRCRKQPPTNKKILFEEKRNLFSSPKKQATAVEESEGCVKNAMELGP
jgi:hypothetical protein